MFVAVGARPILAFALALGGLILWSATPAHAASFTVNRTDDLPDAGTGGTCD
jgi:hypothetical protein